MHYYVRLGAQRWAVDGDFCALTLRGSRALVFDILVECRKIEEIARAHNRRYAAVGENVQ